MKIEVEADKNIEEGRHKGIITKIEYREKPYEYTDFTIELVDDTQRTIRVNYPTLICKSSQLGKLLTRFGHKLVIGNKIDLADILMGKNCSFVTINETTDNGKFTKVLRESVKPIEESIE